MAQVYLPADVLIPGRSVCGAPRQPAQVEASKIRNVAQNRVTSQRTTTDVITFDTATKWPRAQARAGAGLRRDHDIESFLLLFLIKVYNPSYSGYKTYKYATTSYYPY